MKLYLQLLCKVFLLIFVPMCNKLKWYVKYLSKSTDLAKQTQLNGREWFNIKWWNKIIKIWVRITEKYQLEILILNEKTKRNYYDLLWLWTSHALARGAAGDVPPPHRLPGTCPFLQVVEKGPHATVGFPAHLKMVKIFTVTSNFKSKFKFNYVCL
jgi:hypothetical protein